MAILFLAFIK